MIKILNIISKNHKIIIKMKYAKFALLKMVQLIVNSVLIQK
jgi:hypothetical protein